MYEVTTERPRGRFGILTRRAKLGEIDKDQNETFGNGSNVVELTLDQNGSLVIKSTGKDPIKVEFAAEPQMGRPTDVVAFLDPHNPETRTGRSKVTITTLNKGRERLVLKGPVRRRLTLTAGEVRAMEMGIESMRGNVEAAAREALIKGAKQGIDLGVNAGFKKGFDRGYRQGRVVQVTNL